jgi:hypothetical protein
MLLVMASIESVESIYVYSCCNLSIYMNTVKRFPSTCGHYLVENWILAKLGERLRVKLTSVSAGEHTKNRKLHCLLLHTLRGRFSVLMALRTAAVKQHIGTEHHSPLMMRMYI